MLSQMSRVNSPSDHRSDSRMGSRCKLLCPICYVTEVANRPLRQCDLRIAPPIRTLSSRFGFLCEGDKVHRHQAGVA